MHEEIKEAYDLGIRAIMFFGVPNDKDDIGSGAYDHNGVVQEATRISKNLYKDLLIVADTCLVNTQTTDTVALLTIIRMM